LNAAAGIYRNESAAPRIAVRLKGARANTQAIGARIIVTGGPVSQSAVVVCGGRYLSADSSEKMFAAGTATSRLKIEVNWPGGKQSTIEDAAPNRLYEIDEAQAQPRLVPPAKPTVAAAFEDVSERLAHQHHDDSFDDFQRQPLLPRRLSQLGPGVGWWDIDGNGREELIIGTGKGGRLACFRNDGKGQFSRVDEPPWNATVDRDQTAIVGWQSNSVLVGTANYEDGSLHGPAVQMLSGGDSRRQPQTLVTNTETSVGPLAVADYNGDGALDLFVGGRVIPGKYPLAGGSQFYHQIDGKPVLDETNTALLHDAGMVSGQSGVTWPGTVTLP